MPAAAPRRRGRGRGGGMRRDRAGQLRGGRRCLPRRSDRRRRGHRLTEHRLPRTGGQAAGGGAPATVTGTNKEVLCARAAAPPPRPRRPRPRPRPRPRAASQAKFRRGRRRGPPPALASAGSFRRRWARRGTKKSWARSFLVPCGCRKRAGRAASCRGGRGARDGLGPSEEPAGCQACVCPLAGLPPAFPLRGSRRPWKASWCSWLKSLKCRMKTNERVLIFYYFLIFRCPPLFFLTRRKDQGHGV